MTIKTTRLSPPSALGGPELLADSLSTVNDAPAPAGAEAQLTKIGTGSPGQFTDVTEATPFPISTPIRPTSALSQVPVNITAAGDSVVVAALAGQITRLHGLCLIVGAATTLTFKRGATALTGPMPFPSAGTFVLDPIAWPRLSTGVNEPLVVASTQTVNISGWVDVVTGAPA